MNIKKETLHSLASLTLIFIGLLIIISFAGQGAWLQQIRAKLTEMFGLATLVVPYLFISAGLMLTKLNWRFTKPNVFLGAVLLFLSLLGLAKTGATGGEMFQNVAVLIQPIGAYLLFFGVGLAGILIITESSLDDLLLGLAKIGGVLGKFGKLFRRRGKAPSFAGNVNGGSEFTIKRGSLAQSEENDDVEKNDDELPESAPTPKMTDAGKTPELAGAVVSNDPGSNPGVYTPPSMDILMDKIGGEADRGDINKNASVIEQTLDSFGIKAKVVEVNLGPAVTQYALEIALGTKLSKITALQNDLALALAAPTGQIRIEAPIPGKRLVGIEIPNHRPEMVPLKSMITATAMKKSKRKTLIGLGLDVSGEPIIADITKMPHVLVAGATGSGKSVCMNAIIACLLFRASPEEIKFIMVDPKRVELTQYDGIPHLLTPVIVNPEKVVAALEWAVNEMEKRYKLFAEVGVKNIDSYNETSGFQALPYLVVIIDELADVIMFAPSKVEDAITRLAQMARATGIHLILATQRPSVDVITGLIKANVPCRIAFNVASSVDSRVIIDVPGAEKLLGSGDMLYVPPDQAKAKRVQGTFVSDDEIKKLLSHLKNLNMETDYTEEVTTKFAAQKVVTPEGGEEDVDDLFEDAVRVVVNQDKASASLLQRRLSIGYARAARILDQLHAAGIIGPADGSKPRDVLITSADDYFGKR